MFSSIQAGVVASLAAMAVAAPTTRASPFEGQGTLQVYGTNGTNIGCLTDYGFYVESQESCATFEGQLEDESHATFAVADTTRNCMMFNQQAGAGKNFVCTPKVDPGYQISVQDNKFFNKKTKDTTFQLTWIGGQVNAITQKPHGNSKPVEVWWKSNE